MNSSRPSSPESSSLPPSLLGTVHQRFREIAEQYPDRIAAVCGLHRLSYQALDAQSDQLAAQLQAMGVQAGQRVGIFAPRGLETLVAILGILKAGAAYVPFDPSYPLSQLQFQYEDSQPVAMLWRHDPHDDSASPQFWTCPAFELEHIFSSIPLTPATPIPTHTQAGDPAYVMYTSGSTGRPKGVLIPHQAVLRLVLDTNYAHFDPSEVILHLAPLAFDASTFEIWAALLHGACLAIIANPHPTLDEICTTIAQHQVTTAWLTAGLFHLMVETRLDGLKPLRQLLAGGDVLSPRHVDTVLRGLPDCQLINGYGPTENTTFSCCYSIRKGSSADWQASASGSVPIGYPIAHTQIQILDEQLLPVPTGAEGELYVGGLGLAIGYLNQPELTAQRFIPDPNDASGQQRLYKTGDRVRQRADGALEFIGRQDRQVKINGKRVELDEIELSLKRHPQLSDAIVATTLSGAGNPTIIAFVLPKSQTDASRLSVEQVSVEQLRNWIRSELPPQMQPAQLHLCQKFPLGPTGKVNRKQLVEDHLHAKSRESHPQNGPAQVPLSSPSHVLTSTLTDTLADILTDTLTDIWRQVLCIDDISHAQNFYGQNFFDQNFFDLGGSSLQLMRVQAEIKQRLHLDLPITTLFRYPTLATLSQALERHARPNLLQSAQRSHHTTRATPPTESSPAIAIIGMSGRFPGADSIAQFWQNLVDGVESITRFSNADLDDDADEATRSSPDYVKARPILRDVDQFDADFFGMYAREAELTDPQQRVFLECAWQALEDAGYDPLSDRSLKDAVLDDGEHRNAARIGVFAGSSMNTYFLRHIAANPQTLMEFTNQFQVGNYPMLVGASTEFLATRVAYKLNLKGPAMSVHSACSTSLLAVAQACQSLMLNQCDIALAGGVSITFPQHRGYLHQSGGMVSADGHCRAFDADASGTVFGSGAGIVTLKRLADARADGDQIYAVIRGWGINNDGAGKVGFTAPSIDGQSACIRMALDQAGFSAASISYVECHGTATPLGDPIEVAGLTHAYQQDTPAKQFCAIGSVKTNVGHLDSAAGITGLIKTALSLKHQYLPASLHYAQPNPQIDFASSPFYVNDHARPWPKSATPRRAGVSAFGVGGTNVHLVLEEAPCTETALAQTSEQSIAPTSEQTIKKAIEQTIALQLLVLSAREPAALAKLRAQLIDHLQNNPQQSLADIAHTLQSGRHAFAQRCFVVAETHAAAINALEKLKSNAVASSSPVPIVFMFPGQGSQYPQMGFGLYETQPVFRETVNQCAELLNPLLGYDLRERLFAARGDAKSTAWTATEFAQPAIFAIEYALAQWWISLGIHPTAMIGHSVGEFVAATVAGVWSLPDALRCVVIRAQLMQKLPEGGMLAVRIAESELVTLLAQHPQGSQVSIAAINSPNLCVISGPLSELAQFETYFTDLKIGCKRLNASRAFHSAMITPIITPFRELLAQLPLAAPNIPCISSVSGDWLTASQATAPDYWAEHACVPVRFADGMQTAARWLNTQKTAGLFLEVGPGSALSTLARQGLKSALTAEPSTAEPARSPIVIHSLPDRATESSSSTPPASPHLDLVQRDVHTALTALGQIWSLGLSPRFEKLYSTQPQRVSLPTYPFTRKRYWIDAPPLHVTQSVSSTHIPQPELPLMRIDSTATPSMTVPPTAPDQRLQQALQLVMNLLEELSGDEVPADIGDTSFLEMGFDSLFLSQVAQKLQNQTHCKITFRQLLGEYANIPALSAYLASYLPEAAPTPAAAPQIASTAPTPAAPATFAPPQPAVPTSEITGDYAQLFREQLNTLSQLMNRQLETLQALGLHSAPTPAQAPLQPSQVTVRQPSALAVAIAAPVPASAGPAEQSSAADDASQARPSRFQMYKPGQASSAHGLSAAQQDHVNQLIARYCKKTAGSKRQTQAWRKVLADPRAAAGFRSEWKELVYPIVCSSAKGSKIWDVDGNEYIDLVNGYGQTAFGHAPDFVVDAVKAQLDKGFAIGPQADQAGEVAQLFAELTGNERVTFCNTGSEAVMAAMRVARAVTGRDPVVVFNGDYHGQFDEVLVKGLKGKNGLRSLPVAIGIPNSAVENMIVLDYATPATLEWLKAHVHEVAAVIVEPVQSRHPDLQPFEFLREVRALTAAAGTAMVMDEVVTGFRVHPGGIQAISGIRADLATYGKVVGGGLPIGILAGAARFMDALDGGEWQYGDDSYPQVAPTFFAGTFVRHPLVLAAVHAVLKHLKHEGPQLQQALTQRTAGLVAHLQSVFKEFRLDIPIEHCASFFYFNVHGTDRPFASLLYPNLRDRGIHIQDGFPCFLTTAHSDEDFDRIVAAFRSSLEELSAVGILGHAEATNASLSSPATRQASAIDALPLTESQMEIWLAAQLGEEASCAFNESVSIRLAGQLNLPALQAALDHILVRHEALRMRFDASGESARVLAESSFDLPLVDLSSDLSSLAKTNASERLEALIAQDARTPFDLVHSRPARVQLIRMAADDHVLIFTAHHIVCDGWSINVLTNELAECYRAASLGQIPQLAPAPAYSEFIQQERTYSAQQQQATEAWWLNEYQDIPRLLDLPTDRPRGAVRTFNGASLCRRVDASLLQRVRKAGAKQGCTLFVTLFAAFQTLAGRLSNSESVVVGVPTAGQSLLAENEQGLVGHCVNFLPIRGQWTTQTTLAEHLKATSKQVLSAFEHQHYTLGTLVRSLSAAQRLTRHASRLPLTEIQFNLERLAENISLPNLTLEIAPNPKAFVNFDIFLNIIESSAGLRLDCDYNVDLYDEATIARWLDAYVAVLESMLGDVQTPVTHLNCLTPTMQAQQLVLFNQTHAEYPRQHCVHQLIEAQALLRPHSPAIQFGDHTLSYGELERKSNQLAHYLRACISIATSDTDTDATTPRIGIAVDRSFNILVGLLAILKAGCAYVPLDPSHPPARLKHILADAGITALLIDDGALRSLAAPELPVVHLGEVADVLALQPTTALNLHLQSSQLAYLIYTSGSTGLPKGVEISHQALVNLLSSMAREPGISAQDTLLAVTTLAFDIAALELFTPLTVGGRVVIADRDEVNDGFKLLQRIDSASASVMQATPAGWRLLIEAGFRSWPGLKMLCGGEALPLELAQHLMSGGGALWNMYGPTETTVWSACKHIEPDDTSISVGKPIQNTQFVILDGNDQLLPIGVPGQLHIGGDGLARGYHNKPELTAEKFITFTPPAHSEANPVDAMKLYRTGDLACWREDGSLHVLGRMDHQIKLRGFRIELGEIEAQLSRQPGIQSAAVLLREDAGTARLVAYYVDASVDSANPAPHDDSVRISALRNALSLALPDYMIPTGWVRLDSMPLTPNGKLDRNALPASNGVAQAAHCVAPRTRSEVQLTEIWQEVLDNKNIGIENDLFQLGADSIHLFKIVARMRRLGFEANAKMLMQTRTIAALANLLDAAMPNAHTPSAATTIPADGLDPSVDAANSGALSSGTPAMPSLLEFKKSRFGSN